MDSNPSAPPRGYHSLSSPRPPRLREAFTFTPETRGRSDAVVWARGDAEHAEIVLEGSCTLPTPLPFPLSLLRALRASARLSLSRPKRAGGPTPLYGLAETRSTRRLYWKALARCQPPLPFPLFLLRALRASARLSLSRPKRAGGPTPLYGLAETRSTRRLYWKALARCQPLSLFHSFFSAPSARLLLNF
jgi:hypothetical protein